MIYGLLFLLSTGLNILLGLHQWPSVLAGSLQDPDSYMRLLRIEQGVHLGHLVTSVARDDSGAGVMVEWSRLLDIILWLMAAPLSLVIGWHKALFAAGVALGPLGVGALGAACAWAVEPLALRRHLWSAAAAAAILPALASIALPGVVHYHIALLVFIALTAGFVLRALRGDVGLGFLAGLAGGFGIWMTPETMPFVLMAYAGLGLRWLYASNATTILATAAGCFDVIGIAFFIDPPAGGYGDPEIDRLSIVYFSMALVLLVSAAVLTRVQARAPARLRGPLGLAVLGVPLAVWIATYPGVIEGPSGLLPPDQLKAMFGVITEQMAPRGRELIVFLLPGLWAVLYAARRAWAERRPALADLAAPELLGAPRRAPWAWAYVALCALVALLLGYFYLLFTCFSALFAACLLPVALSGMAGALAGVKRIALLALILLVPFLAARAGAAPKAVAGGRSYPSCSLRHIAKLLAPAAGQVVLARAEDTPELLYRSQIETVGSLYEHGVPAFMRDRAAWRAAPGSSEPQAVADTGAKYVLFCPMPGRYLLVANLPPDTLWDALNKASVPPWLRAIGSDAAGWTLYKIVP